MPYSEILTSAGKLIWKFKILWLFGLLAGCASGSGSRLFSFNGSELFTSSSGQMPPFMNFYSELGRLIQDTPGWFFALVIMLACGLGIISWLIGVFGRTGLALGAWLGDSGAKELGLGQLVNQSLHSFWRVTGLTLIVGLPGLAVGLIFVLFWAFGLAASFSNEVPAVMLILLCLGLPLLCLFVPVFWFLGILSELSTVAIVGEGLGVLAGLKRGWEILKRNLGSVILMALLVLVIQIIFGIVMALIFAPVGIGAILGTVLLGARAQLGLGLLLLLGLVTVPVALAVGAVFNTYMGSLWALVFRRLAAAEVPPAPIPPPPPIYPDAPPAVL